MSDVRDSLRPVGMPTLLCGHRHRVGDGWGEVFCEEPAGHGGRHRADLVPDELSTSWPHRSRRRARHADR